MTRILVDADSLVYAAGFSTEHTTYEAEDGRTYDKKSDIPEGAEFRPLTQEEPVEHALALVKRSLLHIEREMDQKGIEFDKLEPILTGTDNWRDKIATLKVYKGNRIDKPKPVHYKAIRRYLRNRWGAVVVNGHEADDELAMQAYIEKDVGAPILVSQDKDLLTVPGRHFNYRRGEWRDVNQQQALVNFYRQILTGDASDHVGGCYRVGPKMAAAYIEDNVTAAEGWTRIKGAFWKSLGQPGCPYLGQDPDEVALETAQLLHLWRFPNDLWQPPA